MTVAVKSDNNGHKRVVITGARGFVGRHLVKELTEEWPGILITQWDLPEVDITKPETYRGQLDDLKPDWVVHLAALAAVGPGDGARERYFRVNKIGTENLLGAMFEESSATRALVISSAELYGLTDIAQRGEAVPELSLAKCRPANTYAESKLAMEQMIEEKFLSNVIRTRSFPHFGLGQKKGFVTADFAAQIAQIERSAPRNAGRISGVLQVGNLSTKRDFTDVRDVVRAYRLLLEKGNTGEVYNVGSGKAWSIQNIVNRLLKLTAAAIRIEHNPALLRSADASVLVADATKLRSLTGWEPQISLDQSLRDILDDWRRYPDRGQRVD